MESSTTSMFNKRTPSVHFQTIAADGAGRSTAAAAALPGSVPTPSLESRTPSLANFINRQPTDLICIAVDPTKRRTAEECPVCMDTYEFSRAVSTVVDSTNKMQGSTVLITPIQSFIATVSPMYTFRECGHSLCRAGCLPRLLEIAEKDNSLLKCPMCSATADADDVKRLLGPEHPYAAGYSAKELQDFLVTNQHKYVLCPRRDDPAYYCHGAVELDHCSSVANAEHVECPVCQLEFCSECKQTPFHFNTTCAEARQHQVTWKETVDLLIRKDDGSIVEKQAKIQRWEELKRDEEQKARECRLCPNCNRVIYRTAGCDSMVCGQDTDGGNRQNGCGRRFRWPDATEYTAQIPMRPNLNVLGQLLVDNGQGVAHQGYGCFKCKQNPIRGLRFESLNLPGEVSLCRRCVTDGLEKRFPEKCVLPPEPTPTPKKDAGFFTWGCCSTTATRSNSRRPKPAAERPPPPRPLTTEELERYALWGHTFVVKEVHSLPQVKAKEHLLPQQSESLKREFSSTILRLYHQQSDSSLIPAYHVPQGEEENHLPQRSESFRPELGDTILRLYHQQSSDSSSLSPAHLVTEQNY